MAVVHKYQCGKTVTEKPLSADCVCKMLEQEGLNIVDNLNIQRFRCNAVICKYFVTDVFFEWGLVPQGHTSVWDYCQRHDVGAVLGWSAIWLHSVVKDGRIG